MKKKNLVWHRLSFDGRWRILYKYTLFRKKQPFTSMLDAIDYVRVVNDGSYVELRLNETQWDNF